MKFSQLLLTVGLVAGGIFAYDALVARTPAEPESDAIRTETPPSPSAEAELPPLPVLEGRGDDIWRSDIERRLATLEVSPTPTTRTEAVAGDPTATPVPAGTEEDEGVEGETFEEALRRARRRASSPQEIATFRAMLEKVERQRRDEQTRRKMHEGLKKIGVELNDAQSNAVVDLTLKFYRGVQSRLQKLPQGEQAREQRLAAFRQLREDYADELYGMVPRTEADRIVEAIDRQANRQRKDGQ